MINNDSKINLQLNHAFFPLRQGIAAISSQTSTGMIMHFTVLCGQTSIGIAQDCYILSIRSAKSLSLAALQCAIANNNPVSACIRSDKIVNQRSGRIQHFGKGTVGAHCDSRTGKHVFENNALTIFYIQSSNNRLAGEGYSICSCNGNSTANGSVIGAYNRILCIACDLYITGQHHVIQCKLTASFCSNTGVDSCATLCIDHCVLINGNITTIFLNGNNRLIAIGIVLFISTTVEVCAVSGSGIVS